MNEIATSDSSEEKFRRLVEAAMDLIRDGAQVAKSTPDHGAVMRMLLDEQANLELHIAFKPLPRVTCDVVRVADGEVVGSLFQLQARDGGALN